MTTNEPLSTSNLLGTILETFPFIVPVRQVVDEDKNAVIEWQWEGKYFDIEDAGDGHIEIFSQVNGVSRHWILTPVDMAKERNEILAERRET